MSNFKGYYMRIGNCYFNSPAPKREGFKVQPKLVMVSSADRSGSGKLIVKELPHKSVKITVEFPVMTPEQYRTYFNALDSMYLQIEYYDESVDAYKTDIFYHTDFGYTPVIYGGKRMILMDSLELIGH